MRRRAAVGGKATSKVVRKRAKPRRAAKTARGRGSSTAELQKLLAEAVERELATSEVLKIISHSPGELQTVFDTILENATRICEAKVGNLFLYENGAFRTVGLYGVTPELSRSRAQQPMLRPAANVPLARAATTKRVLHLADLAAEPAYTERDPAIVSVVELGGARTMVLVPMLHEHKVVGVITIYRQEVRPFTDKQIALVQNFAAQAVIAIENTRLLSELRKRTDDLSESLEQQTATSEVLKVISSSPGALEPVFNAMLENATRICEAKFGTVFRFEGGMLHRVAGIGTPASMVEFQRRRGPFLPEPGTRLHEVVQTRQVAVSEDVMKEPNPGVAGTHGGARSALAVPMVKDCELVGIFVIYRQEVRPFTDKQVELVQNFAAQAVIAIENTRLLSELRQRTDDLTESLEQQTATADVLKVISSSPGALQPVFNAMLENATRICDAKFGILFLSDGDAFQTAAMHNTPPALAEARRREPRFRPAPTTAIGRMGQTKQAVHIADMLAERGYFDPPAGYSMPQIGRVADARTVVAVPMLKDDELIGAIVIYRTEVRPFADKQIELVSNFAAQAVIAIENTRLLNELRQRTVELEEKGRQLAEASQHKSQFLANMSHELRTPLNAILGYTELILDGIYGETPDKAQGVLKRVESNGKHLLGLINDVLDLSKIEAGQLKLSLVDYSMKNVVHNVFSAVEPLAMKKKLNFKVDVPTAMPTGHGDEHRLTQVLLNLVGNAIKFTDAGEVAIKVIAANGSFSVAVRDTGPGIDPANQGKLFEEFQQADNSITKAKGGTGLGLAISRRIVELHGGRLWVESSLGNGATFTFELPVNVEQQAQPS
jgi:signal transduction histidine kinase/DNA-binding FrmR family transcriptional regulator